MCFVRARRYLLPTRLAGRPILHSRPWTNCPRRSYGLSWTISRPTVSGRILDSIGLSPKSWVRSCFLSVSYNVFSEVYGKKKPLADSMNDVSICRCASISSWKNVTRNAVVENGSTKPFGSISAHAKAPNSILLLLTAKQMCMFYFFVVNFEERRLENEMKVLSFLHQPKQIHERAEYQAVVLGKRFDAFVEKLKTIKFNFSRDTPRKRLSGV